jgi:alpha-glucosidase
VSQPDFNFHNPEVREWLKENVKFWLDRGVDGFRLDTVNYYFHDTQLRDNPPRNYDKDNPPVNPYYMQDHVYSISQPENVDFVEELRELLDQ